MTYVTERCIWREYDGIRKTERGRVFGMELEKRTTEAVHMAKEHHHSEPNLKGTLVSVLGVGIIIIVMWFATYLLYAAR